MRKCSGLPAVALFCCSALAFGQTYTIQTFAGGGLPVNLQGLSAVLTSPINGAGVTGVTVDGTGNVYFLLGEYSIVVRLDRSGFLTLVAGNGTRGYSGDGGLAISAQLSGPNGLAVDTSGNVYISDSGNNRIRKVSNGIITTFAGGGSAFADSVPATSAQLNYPSGIAFDAQGNLYIADSYNFRVRRITNGVITTIAGNGTQGYSGDNGLATSAQLNYASGIAIDAQGNLYIGDYGNQRVRKVSSGIITSVAGNGTYGCSGDNGLATSAQLMVPAYVALDTAGNLYISDPPFCDNSYGRIRKVTSGVITTIAGGADPHGGLGDGGPATNASFTTGLGGLALDSSGNLFLAAGDRLRRVSSGVITTVAGGAVVGAGAQIGDNGPAVGAQMFLDHLARGLTVDGSGNVYIADSGLIRRISNGIIATIAGGGRRLAKAFQREPGESVRGGSCLTHSEISISPNGAPLGFES